MSTRNSRIPSANSSLQSSPARSSDSVATKLTGGNAASVEDPSWPGKESLFNAAAVAHEKTPKRQRNPEYYFKKVQSSNGDFVTYRLHLGDGSVAEDKLDKEGVQFSADTPSDQRRQILDRLKAFIHRLEASHNQPPPASLGLWYKGVFAQMKTVLAREITGIISRENLEGFTNPVGYDVWDQELGKLEDMWEPSRPQRGADPDAVLQSSFQASWLPEDEDLIATSVAVASDYYWESSNVRNPSGHATTDRFFAQHILDPRTGETVPGTSSSLLSEDRAPASTIAPSARSSEPPRTRKASEWGYTMVPEANDPARHVMMIWIGSEENKETAWDRVEGAFGGADEDEIRAKVNDMVQMAQTQFKTSGHGRKAGVAGPGARERFRDQLTGFIARNLTPGRPRWSGLSFSAQLERLLASQGELGRLQDYKRQLKNQGQAGAEGFGH
jgi:hypothetical protein